MKFSFSKMLNTRALRILLTLALAIGVGACSTLPSPSVYTNSDAMRASATLVGVVMHVRPVTTQSAGDIGGMYGALLGAVAFSRFGVGSGKALSALTGLGIGAGAGTAVARSASRAQAYEIIVRLPTNEGNKLITVVQGSEIRFKVGQWVYLIVTAPDRIGGASHYRVVPA